ncbi:MAG: UbiD family decarboxylase, partial [Dehalococcoidia bacterium]|nr:UbiD family decarboxylase [Dehalococcoidia bacterium]
MEDLRTWIKNIAAMGELKQIDGAHWDLEIGVLVKLSWVNPNRPALIFDNIVDYPAGFRVLTGSTATAKRVAHTFNIPQVSSTRELVQVFNRKYQGWKQNINEFRPKEVTSGPILENILSGKDVNLYRFPAPKWHEDDGGRFIGTGCAFITQDPDTGETNLGTYRMQLHDEKTAGVFIQPGHHGRMHIEQYHARKKACPVAVSLGHNPLVFRIASAEMKAGAEYGMIGAVHGKPVDVIKEEITGLLIPANSEIVIAGWCQPNKMKEEGPFGEWTGYYGGGRFPAPVIDIERIYYRNNPILVGSPPDRAPNDSSYYLG